ncbi:MAG: hypothetical protein U1A77_14035 [Pirellulales bacterium]
MFDSVKQLAFSFDQTTVATETASGPVEPIELDAATAAEIVRRFKSGASQTTLMSMFEIGRAQLTAILWPAMAASPEVEREVLARLDQLGL